jgi:glycosyltransferase involved in cell wall biosynthesis
MNGKFFFSVITITLNSEKTIQKTIESVLQQKFNNYEYIIIDGASSDNTLKIIKKYEKSLKFYSQKDKNIADAMNKGILRSSGKWIHILNSDDLYVDKNCLYNASKLLINNRLNYFQMFFADLNYVIRSKNNWTYNFLTPYFKACIPHPSMIVSRDQYDKIGYYNDNFYLTADHDLTLRLLKNNYKPIKHNFPLTIKRDGGVSHQYPEKIIHEFRCILINNGVPNYIANMIFFLKISLFNIKKILRSIFF